MVAGDVRIVKAIGRPPPGSPFQIEPLPNELVFRRVLFLRRISQVLKEPRPGDRPIPPMTGGGDLDGDPVSVSVYNIPCPSLTQVQYHIASLRDLPIRGPYPTAAYEQAPKKLLERKCNMDDIADFVTDYITSECEHILCKSVPLAERS